MIGCQGKDGYFDQIPFLRISGPLSLINGQNFIIACLRLNYKEPNVNSLETVFLNTASTQKLSVLITMPAGMLILFENILNTLLTSVFWPIMLVAFFQEGLGHTILDFENITRMKKFER